MFLIETYLLDEKSEEKQADLPKGFQDYIEQRAKTAKVVKADDLADGSFKSKVKEKMQRKEKCELNKNEEFEDWKKKINIVSDEEEK